MQNHMTRKEDSDGSGIQSHGQGTPENLGAGVQGWIVH